MFIELKKNSSWLHCLSLGSRKKMSTSESKANMNRLPIYGIITNRLPTHESTSDCVGNNHRIPPKS